MDNLNVQSDQEPLRVVRQADQSVHYKQQVNVRFLEPPPGPEPAPIIIKVRLLSSHDPFNVSSSEFRSDKHRLRLHNHLWSFDNVHQHHPRLLPWSSVGVSKRCSTFFIVCLWTGERPPTPPTQQQPQIIEKILPAPPAPPRQVIVERLPAPPQKPRQVIYEKWLPYQETKERPVIVERAPAAEMYVQRSETTCSMKKNPFHL